MSKKFKEMVKKIGELPTSILAAPANPKSAQFKRIYVQETDNKGRGVFAAEDIKAGETIEEAPVIILPEDLLSKYPITHYYFHWNHLNQRAGALALGYGSIYNHSYQPNARYKQIYEYKTILFIALRDIKNGEEITVNYNKDPRDNSQLWFDVK